jgi:hypothetical protein
MAKPQKTIDRFLNFKETSHTTRENCAHAVIKKLKTIKNIYNTKVLCFYREASDGRVYGELSILVLRLLAHFYTLEVRAEDNFLYRKS